VLATVKAIEAEGFRDSQLHRLAAMLHDQHPVPLPAESSDR
jgi:cation transport protein ChaC